MSVLEDGFYNLQSPCAHCGACKDIWDTGPEGQEWVKQLWQYEFDAEEEMFTQ